MNVQQMQSNNYIHTSQSGLVLEPDSRKNWCVWLVYFANRRYLYHHSLPCLWWLAMCKKENPSIFMETAIVVPPCKCAVYRKFQKSGLSNNSLPACFKFDFSDHAPWLSRRPTLKILLHYACVSHTKTRPIICCTYSIALYCRATTVSPAIKHHLSGLQIRMGQGYMPQVHSDLHGIKVILSVTVTIPYKYLSQNKWLSICSQENNYILSFPSMQTSQF